MSDAVLSARGIEKRYTDGTLDVVVLKGIDLDVAPSESIAILGASGSGKSTLLHLLGGLEEASAGEVWCCGQEFGRMNERERGLARNQYLGFVYQFHHLLPEFSALENVAMPVLISGAEVSTARDRAADLLTKVGLAHRLNHRPGELSGGERQRVAIARALVMTPRCVLADEPTGNLDETTARSVFRTMLDLRQVYGTALIVVTHDRRLAEGMDRIVELRNGSLVEVARQA
jgi:lipoprotein-releasing system ATP-binding protein